MRHILAPGPIAGLAGRVVEPAPASSADTAGRRRGGSRAAPAGRRGASNSDRPDRRRGRGRTPADSRRGRRAQNGASPRGLAGDPQGRGHARGRCASYGPGKGWIASPRFGPRVRRGRASGPSPSRRPGGNRSTLPQPAEATGFAPLSRLLSRIPRFPVIDDTCRTVDASVRRNAGRGGCRDSIHRRPSLFSLCGDTGQSPPEGTIVHPLQAWQRAIHPSDRRRLYPISVPSW